MTTSQMLTTLIRTSLAGLVMMSPELNDLAVSSEITLDGRDYQQDSGER